MSRDGQEGNEGIAFWLGVCEADVATITHVVGVRGPGIRRAPLRLDISLDVFNALSDLALELGLTLIGQIHAHPGTFVDLSPTDRRFGIAVPDFLSVVAPHYAQRADTALDDCGIHEFVRGRGYVRLSVTETRRRVILDDRSASFLVIGEAS